MTLGLVVAGVAAWAAVSAAFAVLVGSGIRLADERDVAHRR